MASRLEQKYRYVWLNDSDDWEGTNDRDAAMAVSDEHSVLDVVEGKDIGTGTLVLEHSPPDEDEDGDDDDEG